MTLTVRQRSTSEVAESDGALSITIDDITRGQVIASLVRADGNVVLGPVSMQAGDTHEFHLDQAVYSLYLAELSNALVGEDFASFVISDPTGEPASRTAAAPRSVTPMSEAEKIDRLIAAVEALQGATFIRNGREHSAKDAADHLRRKLEAAGDRITSATEFIDRLASRSSLTGEDYQIRLPDGQSVLAGEFLSKALAKLQAGG